MFLFQDVPLCPAELRTCPPGAKLSPQICPTNGNLVAYVNNDDIWLTVISTGESKRLTFTHDDDDPRMRCLSAGNPCYVMQEEFNRYIGFWWQSTSMYNSIVI